MYWGTKRYLLDAPPLPHTLPWKSVYLEMLSPVKLDLKSGLWFDKFTLYSSAFCDIYDIIVCSELWNICTRERIWQQKVELKVLVYPWVGRGWNFIKKKSLKKCVRTLKTKLFYVIAHSIKFHISGEEGHIIDPKKYCKSFKTLKYKKLAQTLMKYFLDCN